MKNNFILVVAGEPNSVFLEVLFKAIKFKKYKSPIILICNKDILTKHMRKNNFKKKINILELNKLRRYRLNNNCLNLIDVKFYNNRTNNYIRESFNVAFKLIKNKFSKKLINGPINKGSFLNKKYLGITEYISHKFSIKKNAMLIFNNKLSVCPVTTHLPLKAVTKKINRKVIKEKVSLIDNFYKLKLGFKPKIAILGLNPHCESTYKFNEDDKIITPTVKYLSKLGFKTLGPFPADTMFLKKNREKFDVVIGMYHDQVLGPLKTLYEYDAINITLGLPFIRISPDHGPNQQMLGKNLSNPLSLINAITFLDKN